MDKSEVFYRLRRFGEPVTLFGETDMKRYLWQPAAKRAAPIPPWVFVYACVCLRVVSVGSVCIAWSWSVTTTT